MTRTRLVFPVLLVEGVPTLDGRLIRPGAVTVGDLPLPVTWLSEEGALTVVGMVTQLTRGPGPLVTDVNGVPYPDGSLVWSGYGYLTQIPRLSAARDVTEEFSLGADLSGVSADLGGNVLVLTAGEFCGVHLSRGPSVWPGTHWRLATPEDEQQIATAEGGQ